MTVKAVNFFCLFLLIFISGINNYPLEFIILGLISALILSFFKTKSSLLMILSLLLSWVGTTKGLEGDYFFYFQEYNEATNSSFPKYISEHIKSPFFYFLFYINNYLGLSFRQATGVLLFVGNLIFFETSMKIFHRSSQIFFCNLFFLIFFPIFDSSTHLFRQHIGSIIIIWAISKINILGAVTAIFTHLTTVIFLPQFITLITWKKFIAFGTAFGIFMILFSTQINDFIIKFIIDRLVNSTELEQLNLPIYIVIFICTITLINPIYRERFLIPILSMIFFIYIFNENSEIVFRTSKFFNYLIPVALVCLAQSISSFFKQKHVLLRAIQINTAFVLVCYFIYKLILFPNWTYFQ